MTSLEIQFQVTIKVTRDDYKKVTAALTQHLFDWYASDLIDDDIDDRRIATNLKHSLTITIMGKYSKNAKLNRVLCTIEKELLEMCDSAAESLAEIKRYYKEYKALPDYSIVEHGNLRFYTAEIIELYAEAGYKVNNYTDEHLQNSYKHQVGYIVRQLIRN